MLIRRCSIDFGIRIEIDSQPQEHRGPDGHPSASFLTGRIHYGDVDQGAPTGDFVYVTTAPIADVPPNTQPGGQGATLVPSTSSDSSRALDDEQFEQYRSLGADAARGRVGRGGAKARRTRRRSRREVARGVCIAAFRCGHGAGTCAFNRTKRASDGVVGWGQGTGSRHLPIRS